ncbi:hypothetical protein [Shimia sp. NS0008-38b]|uniref:NAD(P)/FAD-dependent oxidoreductase n=1 Tax=Shimia sp. NS0008-38b TaxID=3127653 RepID=UPI003341C13C
MTQMRYDVAIAGDGPAGLAAAIALLERGFSVVNVSPSSSDQPSRAEMLPPAADPIITRLGIAELLDEAVPLRPALGLWANPYPERSFLSAQRSAISINRNMLSSLMRKRVKSCGGHFRNGRLQGISGSSGEWQIAVGSGVVLRTRFAIDATGRPAHLARRLGARLQFGAQLVARTMCLPERVQSQLVIEATENGWWYALPFPRGGMLGFLGEPQIEPDVPTLLPMPGDFAMHAKCWDARNAVLNRCTGPGWLATGDAATAFDPIASQGLFNALSGGFFAGNAAACALTGQPDALETYAQLVARTASHTHHAMPQHYATAHGHSDFWHQRRAATFSLPAKLHGRSQRQSLNSI